MSEFEQLETLRKNISKVHDPAILFAMNQTARKLEENIDKIKDLIAKVYNN